MSIRGGLVRLSKPKSTTHDLAQAVKKIILKQKNKLPKQLVRSVGCRYGVQRVLLNLATMRIVTEYIIHDVRSGDITYSYKLYYVV